jgi:hypothetical protein
VFIEGDVAPSSWHPDLISEYITEPGEYETATSLVEAALLYRRKEELGLPVDMRLGLPVQTTAPLRELANPGLQEAMGLLANQTEGRRRLRELNFTWAQED